MYEIVIAGRLPDDWVDWVDGFNAEVTEVRSGSVTRLVGPVRDQAELHGLLERFRDLAIPVVSLRQLPPGSNGSANTPAGT